jgi:class 3 adenylate cyclase
MIRILPKAIAEKAPSPVKMALRRHFDLPPGMSAWRLNQLKVRRKTIVDPSIGKYRGRIVKTTDDGMLVEFLSAVDAARCAAADPTACAAILLVMPCSAPSAKPLQRSRYNSVQIACRAT